MSSANEIVETPGGVKLRLSFGGAQVEINREPVVRDKVYLLVAAKVSQVKLPPGDDADFLLATVTGTAQAISRDQFFEYGGKVPVEQLEIDGATPGELEALENELAEGGR